MRRLEKEMEKRSSAAWIVAAVVAVIALLGYLRYQSTRLPSGPEPPRPAGNGSAAVAAAREHLTVGFLPVT